MSHVSAIVDVNILKPASFKTSAAVGRQSAELWRVGHGRHLDGD